MFPHFTLTFHHVVEKNLLRDITEQNVSHGKFNEIWRDSLMQIGKDLMIDESSLKLTWDDVMHVRQEIKKESVISKFFSTNKTAAVASGYCVDKAGYLEDVLNRSQDHVVVNEWRSKVSERLDTSKEVNEWDRRRAIKRRAPVEGPPVPRDNGWSCEVDTRENRIEKSPFSVSFSDEQLVSLDDGHCFVGGEDWEAGILTKIHLDPTLEYILVTSDVLHDTSAIPRVD